MIKAKVTFNFLSYWHAGSGMGEGPHSDALVIKDRDKLPFCPGRTVKGLFREAVQTAQDFDREPNRTTHSLFGSSPDEAGRSPFETDSGILSFTNATLSQEDKSFFKANPGSKNMLYTRISSTRINENGIADDNSLRDLEVTVPLVLISEVSSPDDSDEWISVLTRVAPLIREVGTRRRRGFGRVLVTVTRLSEVNKG